MLRGVVELIVVQSVFPGCLRQFGECFLFLFDRRFNHIERLCPVIREGDFGAFFIKNQDVEVDQVVVEQGKNSTEGIAEEIPFGQVVKRGKKRWRCRCRVRDEVQNGCECYKSASRCRADGEDNDEQRIQEHAANNGRAIEK